MTLPPAFDRMPHRGAMLLLDRVIEDTETHVLVAAKDHRGANHPLRRQGRLETLALVEIGAQAAAAHASLHGLGGAHIGLLLGLRDLEIRGPSPDRLPPPLLARAERLEMAGPGARYRIALLAEGHGAILSGEALLSIRGAP